MKVTAFEVPSAVVIVTEALDAPVSGGTVTVQLFCAGQLVGATWPLNVATIWPLGLRKLVPATSMPWPGAPVAGTSPEITGGPPGVGAAPATVDEVVGAEDPPLRVAERAGPRSA